MEDATEEQKIAKERERDDAIEAPETKASRMSVTTASNVRKMINLTSQKEAQEEQLDAQKEAFEVELDAAKEAHEKQRLELKALP